MTLNLESTQGLHRGLELQYCDIQAGDGFTIDTEASLRLVQAGCYELRCDCDTNLALPVAEAESAFYRTGRGTWVRLEAGRGTVPFDAARGEATTLVIGRQAPQ